LASGVGITCSTFKNSCSANANGVTLKHSGILTSLNDQVRIMSGQIDLDIVKLFGLGLSLQKHEPSKT
jgi:hypothetical protein